MKLIIKGDDKSIAQLQRELKTRVYRTGLEMSIDSEEEPKKKGRKPKDK